MRDEKLHAVVARSTCRSENVQNTSKHFSVGKTPGVRTTFRGSDVEKVHAAVARSTFRSQMLKTPGVGTTFGGSDVASHGRRKGLCTLSKVSKT